MAGTWAVLRRNAMQVEMAASTWPRCPTTRATSTPPPSEPSARSTPGGGTTSSCPATAATWSWPRTLDGLQDGDEVIVAVGKEKVRRVPVGQIVRARLEVEF